MKTTTSARAEAALSNPSTAVSQGFAAMESIVLTDGSVLELHQNHVVTIMLNGMQQTIELISTTGTSSVFRVGGPGGAEITLNVGESRQLDLNGDGTNDVSLLLSSVNGGSADFSVTNLGPGSGTTGAGNDLTLFALVGVVAAVLVVGAVVLLVRRRRA